MKRKKYLAAGAAAGAVLLALLAVLLLTPAEEAPAPLKVLDEAADEESPLSYVTRGDLEHRVTIPCKFRTLKQENLRFQLDGRLIGQVYVEVGDEVKQGQLLAELENEELDDRLEKAREQAGRLARELQYAREALEIVRDSYGQTEQYEKAVERLEEDCGVADLRLKELQEQRRRESLYAGIDGAVTYVRKYERSSLESDFIVISDRGEACYYADTEHYSFFQPGMEVILTTGEGEIPALVTAPEQLGFEDEAPGENGKKRIYLVPKNDADLMSSSGRVELDLVLDSRKDVLIVRERAVFFAGGQAYVFYENENGVREAKPVELGMHAVGAYEVLSGLTEGEALFVS